MKTDLTTIPISDLTLNEIPVSCPPATTLQEAARLMAYRNVGSIVIMENGRPIGIFTERDFLKKIAPQKEDLRTDPISKHMTPHPKSLPLNASIASAIVLMRTGHFRHILLQTREGDFVGVLSLRDVLNYVCDTMSDGNDSDNKPPIV